MSDERRLYVLRHAKSSWDDPGQDDHDRPLAPRGRRAVEMLRAHIRESGIAPDLVLCSTARRTRDTLEGVNPGGQTLIEAPLYSATAGDLLERLRMIPAETGSVMVIGHNPAVQMVVLKLAAEENGNLDDIKRKFPTGALATLQFSCGWDQLAPHCAELTGYVRPKALSYP